MIPAGIDPARLKPGENRMPCPRCERGPHDTALAVRRDTDGSLVWHCHRCGLVGAEPAGGEKSAHSGPRQAAQVPARAPGLSEYARLLWATTRPIGGIAADYLRARVCTLPPRESHLRWLPSLQHPCGYVGPAMVALITDTIDGTPLSLHRTWIQANGEKAPVQVPRMLLKDHPIGGGVIRLWPDAEVDSALGVAEGIETALSLAHGFSPVWSTIDAGHLENFPVLDYVRDLVIAADNDPAGRRAAERCATRWAPHAAVRVILPEAEGADLNDEVRQWAT